MKIYIPSTGRADNVVTLASIPPSWYSHTFIVCYSEEANAYEETIKPYPGVGILVCNIPRGIANKRQWIIDLYPRAKLLMLDDDLTFATRRKDEPTKFLPAEHYQIEFMLWEIQDVLNDYVHVSVCPREGGNRKTEKYSYNTRINRVLGYHTGVFEEHSLRYKVPFMEDFYMNLSLLTRGYDSCTLNEWVQDQKGSNTKGGLSGVRNLEGQARAAHELHAEFPDFVKVVQKETKTAWGGGTRTDVQVQWKKARRSHDNS